ncbi:MAG TPA: serine protease, partial [Psychromonas sp.]
TIAVNLGGSIHHNLDEIAKKRSSGNGSFFTSNFKGVAQHLAPSKQAQYEKVIDWRTYNIAELAIDAMQSTIARQKLAAYPADYVIEIARNVCGTLEFERSAEMIKLGYHMAEHWLKEV